MISVQRVAKARGVKGAASWCALAAIGYLLARQLLQLLISFLMGLHTPGASLANPAGFGQAEAFLLALLAGLGAMAAPVAWLLRTTRLQPADLRLTLPPKWSPAFCVPVFLGVANAGNVAGGLLARLFHTPGAATELPAGGGALLAAYLTLCLMPAVAEEILFRGALQGLMRPCGSAAAIFAPALLFGLLHLNLAQSITAFACGLFLGWMAERTGSILPGMALHLANNSVAFLNIYLQLYAPANISFWVQALILVCFPLLALWLVWRARSQGFRFSAGLRPGVDATAVFSSPAYLAAVLFLALYSVYLTGVTSA